ncbi:tRNA pseudouridine synthase-like 1 isoform 5-T5 [Megaptera novaeangliae]
MGAGSVRARYLVYFQYLGTDFNGVAAVRGAQHAIGVQNYLEEAAERLNSVVPVKFTISSRTDAGVHALSNAAHLDVQRRSGLPPFSPEVLMEALNTHLRHPAIRVLQAFRVPSHFHARHAATSRTYLYRLVTGCRRPDQLPVFERNRCWALRADCLDVAAMREAAQHLLGTHDFRAFQSAGSPATSPVRTLRRASVSPDPAGSPFVLPEESRPSTEVRRNFAQPASKPPTPAKEPKPQGLSPWERSWPHHLPRHPRAHSRTSASSCSQDPGGTAVPAPKQQSSGFSLPSTSFIYKRLGGVGGCGSGAWSLRASPSYTDRWAVSWGPARGGAWGSGGCSSLHLGSQVRRMTSVLVAVGLGALMPAQVKGIVESQDPLGRHQSRVAPAHGLFLKAVLYEGFGPASMCPQSPQHGGHR